MIERVQGRVQRLIDRMSGGVGPHRVGLRRHRIHFANCGFRHFRHRRVNAGSHQGQERRAVRRSFLRLKRHHALGKHVGQHLTPEGTARAATGKSHRVKRYADLLDDIQAILLAVGYAFQQRANQIGALMFRGQPDPSSARGGVQVRRPFAH